MILAFGSMSCSFFYFSQIIIRDYDELSNNPLSWLPSQVEQTLYSSSWKVSSNNKEEGSDSSLPSTLLHTTRNIAKEEKTEKNKAPATETSQVRAAVKTISTSTKRSIASSSQTTVKRTQTDTGIDVSDPELYREINLHGNSSTATVMGMASGYDLGVYQRFVGSLRQSGYQGHIILGVAPDIDQLSLEYLKQAGVQPMVQQWVNCTYAETGQGGDSIFSKTTCSHPYPDIKIRWSRFPIARDWLQACTTCTGPVLIMDVRDSFFQLDPFGPGSPVVKGLQVFEEHKNQVSNAMDIDRDDLLQ